MKYLSVNRVTTILFVVMITTVLFAGPVVSNALAKEKVWKIKMQLYTVPGKWDCQWVVPKKFAEFVKERTNGRVDISIHPAGELVGPR